MATGQTMLDLMETMDYGLQLQSGESGVTRGLRALNAAQDHLESLLALDPNVVGSSVGTVTTAASTETTSVPTGLLRLDRLQYIDASTSRPAWDLERVGPVGDHNAGGGYPPFLLSSSVTGKPLRYWTNAAHFYWDPLPDATHTVRYYGLKAASDITAGGTFAYPDLALMAVAQFATKMLRIGKDDDVRSLSDVGMQVFAPVLQAFSRFNRDRVPGYDYRYTHSE
tara:strand:+ start:623 stop:1297 length:675 start_codon:yes stop_codon:yes gene_type:complete